MRTNEHGLTRDNLLRLFPHALKQDKTLTGLGAAGADLLLRRLEEIERLTIYPRIAAPYEERGAADPAGDAGPAELPEDLLDILAYDFKVDWWDADYTVEEKRRTLKDSWKVHKTLGTKAAVETAISAIYPNSKVQEWYEYGGQPYHFRLEINISEDQGDAERQARVLERLNCYKNLRSHLDSIDYSISSRVGTFAGGAFVGSVTDIATVIPIPDDVKDPHTLSRTPFDMVTLSMIADVESIVDMSGCEPEPPVTRGRFPAGGATTGIIQEIYTEVN